MTQQALYHHEATMSESVYIAITGGDIEYPEARDSIQLIQRREGDSHLNFIRATKGYEARQAHLNNFLSTTHDYILFLDADHVFPRDALERLRSRGKRFVSGFYVRRRYDIIVPVWYEPYTGELPLKIWSGAVEDGVLYEIGASGWGCVLVHRDVIEGVREVCRGEWEILEDDIDILPYDVQRVMDTMRKLREAVLVRNLDAAQEQLGILGNEIYPFSKSRTPTGSDIRFAVFARMAGYQLYGDAGVNARHIVHYPLGLADYQRYLAANPGKLAEELERAAAQDG